MNESQNDVIEFETNLEKKEKAKNMLKININSDENKYVLKLYLSEEKNSIIFKLEQERIFSSFHFEKFFLNDFRQKSILFMRDYTITQVLSRLKKLLAKKETEISIEVKDINNIIIKMKNEEEKCLLNFDLKKIILTQNQLNPKLVEQIQENEALVNFLQKQITNMTKTLQEKTDLINSLNNNIININKTINDINNVNNNINNNTNSINNTINTSLNKKEEEKEESEEPKEEKEKEEIKKNTEDKASSNEEEKNEIEDKRYISNNRKKKNKKKNKKIKFFHGDNQNKNNQNNNNKNTDDNSIFCFENVEIIGNKKIFELLVVFNVIMILIILCLIGSIYSIKSNLEYEKILEEEFMNKLSYLNVYNDYGEDNYDLRNGMGGWDQGEFLIDEQQKLFFKEEIISKQNNKIKDIEFNLKYKSSKDGKKFDNFYSNCKGVVDTLLLLRNEGAHKFGLISKNIADILRGNKVKDSQIKKNFMIYNLNRHDIFEYNIDKNFEEIYNSFIKNIFGFFNEKGEFEDRIQFMGRILEIEIYELKYIK